VAGKPEGVFRSSFLALVLVFPISPFPYSMRLLTLLALIALLLNACGLKGPLYLPQEPAPEKLAPTQPQKSPDTEKKR